MGCLPDNDFHIEVSKWRDFRDPIFQDLHHSREIFWPTRDIPWEECTTYFWHVRANMEGMEDEPWSETWSFVIQPGDILCPTDLGGPEIPPEFLIPHRVLLLMDANCRSGPTTEYSLLSILPVGNQYEIQATNTPGDSWMVFDPSINNTCWVSADLVDVIGDTSLVQIIDPVPPSTPEPEEPTPVDCSQYPDSTSCTNNAACWWDAGVFPNGACKNK
jgi:hypothetical protein